MDEVPKILAGAVGTAITGVAAIIGYWWKGRRNLRLAAVRCYDRLLKIQQAQKLGEAAKKRTTENEIYLLGAHVDLFLSSINAALTPHTRTLYWNIYEDLVPIIIRHDVRTVPKVVSKLQPVAQRHRP
jgi:hypothetical protein